nr:hypothetical protein [Tanacetum cinerariifolium]
MSTQQDIYAAGFENDPPMLNKDNYVSWSSRLFRYAKSKTKGKLIYNSITKGLTANLNVNKHGNGNVVAAWAKGNGNGNNGDLDEIEEVNAKCILMANLQQALTSDTQSDKAPVYDSKGSDELILIFFPKVKMSRDILTIGSTMRISLLYRGEYSQWVERFMNYLEEQTDGEAMINSIKNGDQPLPRVTQVSISGTNSTDQPPLKDKSMWSDQEKRIQKIDRLARSFLIQGLPNDIYSLIDNNKTAKDLWDALARHMLGSEHGEQDRKATVLYEYETFKATEGELLLDTYIRYLQVINDLKKCGSSKDNCELNF